VLRAAYDDCRLLATGSALRNGNASHHSQEEGCASYPADEFTHEKLRAY
jgi:hypothetical protein